MRKSLFSYIFALITVCACNRAKTPPPSAQGQTNRASVQRQTSVQRQIVVEKPPQLYTLNGISYTNATYMIAKYRAAQRSTHTSTTIWFSKAYIDAIITLHKDHPNINGIRIYFSKTLDPAPVNAVVIVATEKGQVTDDKGGDDLLLSSSDFLGTMKDGVDYNKFSNSKTDGSALYDHPCVNDPTCKTVNTVDCTEAWKFLLNFKGGNMTTKSVWYPINLVRKLAYELADAQAAKKPADGVRLYFIKKPPYASLKVRETFLFVTTFDDGGIHRDYYDCHLLSAHMGEIKSHQTSFKGSEDNGEECPQNCDDGDHLWI